MLQYQALFEPAEEGGFVVTFPDVEPAITQGDDEADALFMAADVLSLALMDYVDRGVPLPKPKAHRGARYRTVRLPALISAKAELYSAFLKAGIGKAELARRLRIPRTNVDRLFDFQHQSRLDQIEAALAALGKELSLNVVPLMRRSA